MLNVNLTFDFDVHLELNTIALNLLHASEMIVECPLSGKRRHRKDKNHDDLSVPHLSPDGTLVEGELLTLQDVPITAPTLARTASNDSIETRSLKLPLKRLLDLSTLGETLMLLSLNTLTLLHLLLLLAPLLLPPTPQTLTIVRLIPLPKRRSIDLHDGSLGQSIRTHELVIRRMEDDTDDTDFTRDALAAPGEVAGIETQGAEFAVAAACADEMDALGADTGVGRLTAFLEGSVLFTSDSGLMCGRAEAHRFMHTSFCGISRAWHLRRCACDVSHE